MSEKTETIHQWDKYTAEAAVPDFVLQVSEDEEIRFTNPTGTGVFRISQGVRNGDLELILMGLAGENYPRMQSLLGEVGHGALPKLIEDMMDHFHFYDEVEMTAPSGRVHTLTRPTEIAQRIREGWKVKGELPASLG